MAFNERDVANIGGQLKEIFGIYPQQTSLGLQNVQDMAAYIKRAFDSSHALNAAINQLPIYIIIGHSSIDLNVELNSSGEFDVMNSGKDAVEFQTNDGFFGKSIPVNGNKDDIQNWLRHDAQFVIYPTPPAALGALYSDIVDENEDHILKSNLVELRHVLLTQDLTTSKIWQNKSGDQREAKSQSRKFPSYFLPGSVVPTKEHQFSGTPLTAGGFGIIKLVNIGDNSINIESVVRKNLRRSIVAKRNGNSVYYITNAQSYDENDKELIKILQTYESIPMRAIMQSGGGGFYVSLSCSEFHADLFVNRGTFFRPNIKDIYDLTPPENTLPIHPRMKLFYMMLREHNLISLYNKEKWKAFFKILNPRDSRYTPARLSVTSFMETHVDPSERTTGYKILTQPEDKRRGAAAAKTRHGREVMVAANENRAGHYIKQYRKMMPRWRSRRDGLRHRIRYTREQEVHRNEPQETSCSQIDLRTGACITAGAGAGWKIGGMLGHPVAGAAVGAVAGGIASKRKEKINGGRRSKTRRKRHGKHKRKRQTRRNK